MPHRTRTHRSSDHAATPAVLPEAAAQPFATARHTPAPIPWSILGVVSAGGMLGALARYGISTAFPHAPGGFPWATFAINISGCLLIGMLMVAVTDLWPGRTLLRPFLGTGVLGGYTTFSTYIVDAQHLLDRGAAATALAYLAATVISALAAVWAGSTLVRIIIAALRRLKEAPA